MRMRIIALALTLVMILSGFAVLMSYAPVNNVSLNALPDYAQQSNSGTHWYDSQFDFNLTGDVSQYSVVSSTNPGYVNYTAFSTQYYVNGTSNTPESYGYYDLSVNGALGRNVSMSIGGGTSFSYAGVNTEETWKIGGTTLLTLTTYDDSSSQSTLDWNGTVYSNNYALPTIYMNFTSSGITVYSAASGSNGAYTYKQTFDYTSGILNVTTTDNGFSGTSNQYHGWSIRWANLPAPTLIIHVNKSPESVYPVSFSIDSTVYTTTALTTTVSLYQGIYQVKGLDSFYYSPSGLSTTSQAIDVLNGTIEDITLNYTFNTNQTLLYEFQVNNTGPSFTNGYFPFTFTNESLFHFNITNSVVQNVKFLYSNGTQIKGFIPTGQDGLPNTDQGSGKWLVYLTNFSMNAGQSENIYMQVFPYTVSSLNANFNTNNSNYIGFHDVDFANTGQVWVHSNTTNTEITRSDSSIAVTGPNPSSTSYIIYSANISVNLTNTNNIEFSYQYYNISALTINSFVTGPATSLNNTFGDYSTGYGAGFQYNSNNNLYGLWHNVTGNHTGNSEGSPFTFIDSGSYTNNTLTFSGSDVTKQSVSLASFDMGGLIQAFHYYVDDAGTDIYGTTTTTLSNLYYWNLSQSGITQSNIGPVTSISPTASNTGNYILFNETGLPYGQSWNVSLTNKTANVVNSIYASTTNTAKAFLPSGYNYSFSFNTFDKSYYKIVNLTGIIYLSPKANATVNITLTNVSYDVVFHETGLLSGNTWGINFNGTDHNTTSASLTLIEKNGSYPFTVLISNLYNSNVSSGYANVSGKSVNLYIGFTYHAFNITFSEVGLPSDVQWSMTINGTVYHSNVSNSNILLFQGKAGSYDGIVNNASYYTPVDKYFNFTITGNAHYTIDYGIVLTFIETGYNGIWHITIDGKTYSSSTNTIVATVSPGQVVFNVWGVSGYTINPEVVTQTYTSAQTIKIAFTVQPASFENVLISTPMVILYFVLAIMAMAGVVYWRLKHER